MNEHIKTPFNFAIKVSFIIFVIILYLIYYSFNINKTNLVNERLTGEIVFRKKLLPEKFDFIFGIFLLFAVTFFVFLFFCVCALVLSMNYLKLQKHQASKKHFETRKTAVTFYSCGGVEARSPEG